MSTTVLPRGRQEKNRLSWEATYGVNPAASFNELNVYTSEFNRQRPLLDDDVLGAGFANNVDDRPAAPNIEDATGKLSVPLDLAQIGFWLGAALGRVAATGTTPKSHAFTSGNTSLPTMYLEREIVAAANFEAMRGAFVKSMKFPFGPASGYQQVDLELGGAQILEPYTSTGAGTPTVEALANRVPKTVALIKVDTTQVASIISGDATLTNEVTLDRYVGDAAFPSLGVLEAQSLALNVTARYKDDTFRNYGAVGSGTLPGVHQVDVIYSLGANLSLTLTAKNVRFEPVDLGTSNGKTRTISLKGRAELDATNAMLTATLLNAHASY